MVLFCDQDISLTTLRGEKRIKARSRTAASLNGQTPRFKRQVERKAGTQPAQKAWAWQEWALRTGVSLDAYQGVSHIGIYTDFT